jgi:hypothetical protein
MADDPVRLMRDQDRPVLPPLPESPETTLPNAAPPDAPDSASPDGSESE